MVVVAVLPALAAMVAWVFAARLWAAWRARGRDPSLAWSFALALFGAASAAVTVGVVWGWTPAVFGIYWIAGALLNVPLLAVGQLLLLDPRRRVLYWTLAGVFAAWSLLFTLLSGFDGEALALATRRSAIPLGRDVLGGSLAYRLVGPFNATFLVVVGGSVWSAVRTRRWSVLLIALGVSIAAAGSSAVGSGRDVLFSVLLAAGVTTMYAGFRAVSPAPRRRDRTAAA